MARRGGREAQAQRGDRVAVVRSPTSRGTAVLLALAARPGASTTDIAAATGSTVPQVQRALKYGRGCGIVDSEQRGLGWYHWLIGSIRLPPLARDRVLLCITSGVTTRAEIAARLKMRRDTVQRATMRLKQDGQIVVNTSSPTHRLIATPTEQAAK